MQAQSCRTGIIFVLQAFLWFDRAAGFPLPRPQDADADARRSCQGWPLFAATEGLAFT
jgi:hypothetical protein